MEKFQYGNAEMGEQHGLLPETHQLLDWIEVTTGKPVEVRADPAVSDRGRAIYAVSNPDPSRHLILYDPSYEQFRDHLVAHECGHIAHFSETLPKDRTVPVITSISRQRAMNDLVPGLDRLTAQGVQGKSLRQVADLWISGTVAQLSDTPSDIRIESWIWETFPGLRDTQRHSLEDLVTTLTAVLDPTVAEIVPPEIWLGSNAINYALVKSISRMLDQPDLVQPFLHTPAAPLGEELIAMVDTGANVSLTTDRQTTDLWAERLGFEKWFEWKRLDKLWDSH